MALQQLVGHALADPQLLTEWERTQSSGLSFASSSAALARLKSNLAYQQAVEQLCSAGVEGCVKDSNRAQELKLQGNAALNSEAFAGAALLYTGGLQLADQCSAEGIKLSASLHCNRALCALRLHEPAKAVADCSEALALNPQYGKAFYRRAQARTQQGSLAAAAQDAATALKLSEKQDYSSKFEQDIQQLITRIRGAQAEANSRPGRSCLEPPASNFCDEAVQNFEQLVQQVAPKLVLQQNPQYGRHLAAGTAASISAGTELLVEKPFASVLMKAHRKQLCHRCFAKVEMGAVYCSRCPLAVYCNAQCRAADDQHIPGGPECGFPWPLLLPPDAILSGRIAIKATKANGVVAAHVASLESHSSCLPFEAAATNLVLSGLLEDCLQRCGVQQGQQQMPVSAATLYNSMQQVAVNGIAVVPPIRGSEPNRLGLAIYPVAALLNHSCNPNTSLYFTKGNRLVLRNTSDLRQGAQLFHCYGPQLGEMITEVRKKLLRAQYNFTCRCAACEGSHRREECMVGLQCPGVGCTHGIVASAFLPAGLVSLHDLPASVGTDSCSSCGMVMGELHREQLLQELYHAADLFEQAGDKADADLPLTSASAINSLHQCLRVRRRILHADNEVVGGTEAAIAKVLELTGDLHTAQQHLLASVSILAKTYPFDSLIVAVQHAQLALLYPEDSEDRAQYLSVVKGCLDRHFGADLDCDNFMRHIRTLSM